MKANTRDNVFPAPTICGARAVAVRWPLVDPSEATDPESRRRRYEEYLTNLAFEKGDDDHQTSDKPNNNRPILDVYSRIGNQLYVAPSSVRSETYCEQARTIGVALTANGDIAQGQHARQGAYNLLGVYGGRSPAPRAVTFLPGMMDNWTGSSGSQHFQCGSQPRSS
jgi:hypothetical protein